MTIALIPDKEGIYDIQFEKGLLKQEAREISFAKHNMLCFGRLNKNLTKNQALRQGGLETILSGLELYSTSWIYFMEGKITFDNMNNVINDFNNACDRDFKAGLLDSRVSLKKITKLSVNILNFNIQIGSQDQDFVINLK